MAAFTIPTIQHRRARSSSMAGPLCPKCGINLRLSYHAYCRDCRIAYRRENPEVRHPYTRKTPFPELCGKCKQRPHAKGHAWCDECKCQANKEWRERGGGAWSSLTPEQRQKAVARRYVKTRVDRGHMEKLTCAVCGDPNSQAHHHNGYSKEHALDVVWLCQNHHLEAERKLKAVDRPSP